MVEPKEEVEAREKHSRYGKRFALVFPVVGVLGASWLVWPALVGVGLFEVWLHKVRERERRKKRREA